MSVYSIDYFQWCEWIFLWHRYYLLLENKDYYTVGSDFNNTGYAFKGKHIVVCCGKNGMLHLGLDQAEDFAKELLDVVQDEKENRQRRI